MSWLYLGNAVVSGMYSFHASAAAYTDYWNNAFGEVALNLMGSLSHKHTTHQQGVF